MFEYIEQQVRASLAKGAATPAADLRIPILPVSAKTGENAELIQQQVWDVLSTRKSTEVLAFRIDRFNQEVAKYSGILDDRLALFDLDAQGQSRRRAQLQQEVKDYAQQREAFLAGLQRLLESRLSGLPGPSPAACSRAWRRTRWHWNRGPCGCHPNRQSTTFSPSGSVGSRSRPGRRLQNIDEAFLKRLQATIEKQKASMGARPSQAVTIEEYVLHWRGLDGNPLAQAVPLAGGVGIAGLLVGAGTLWQTATVTTATPGILATIGTFFTGAPVAAASSFMLFGVPAIAVGALLLATAFFANRGKAMKLAEHVRAACAKLAERIEEDKWQLIDQLKANQAQRIAADLRRRGR